MGEEPQSDDGISTVNTNATVVINHRLGDLEDHDRAITVKGLESNSDLIKIINRVTEEHGAVTGTVKLSSRTAVIYCDNY